MAKKRKSKSEVKEERRRAIEAKRQETGWQPPEPDLEPPRVLEDARILLGDLDDPSNMEQAMTVYLSAMVDSDWMIDEPEFEAIYFPPGEMTYQYAEVLEEEGWDPDSFQALGEEERSDLHLEVLTTTVDDLRTEEIEDDILDAIERLRARLTQDGNREQAARAGLLLDFMEQPEADAAWSNIGLVLALGQRSLDAGFALTGAAAAADGVTTVDGWEPTPEMQAVLEQYPGLVEYMVVRQDRTWDRGVQSLFWGDLWLDIFAVNELEPQLDTWARAIEHGEARDKEAAGTCLEEIRRYAAGLLTTERIERIMARLEVVLESEPLEPGKEQFVRMVADALVDEETAEGGRAALIAAFAGELGLLFDEMQDEDEWEEDG